MSGDSSITGTIKEEVADMAKAVAADVKAIAAEVADTLAEGKAELCGDAATDAVAVKPLSPCADEAPRTSGIDEQK